MDPAETLVEIREARKAFGAQCVLESLNLRVGRGESLAVLGQSGSGKSVLLQLIIGLLAPDGGDIRLWGRSVTRWREKTWVPLRRRMGFVFQSGALFDSMSVGENIAFPLRERGGVTEADLSRRVGDLLEWVELPGCEAKRPSELSGGMRKRVALARTLAGEPELILFDEPTTGLDPVTGHTISRLIRDTGDRVGATSIVVTHDIDCARTVAERWAFLHGGRILADGTPRDFFSSEEPDVRAFFSLWSSSGMDPSRRGVEES